MTENIDTNIMVDKFWESVPRAWHRTREIIRGVASEKYKLTVEQFQVLRRIRRGITSVSAIAADSSKSRSAVSKTVDALVKKGFVTRHQDPSDRRNIPLNLTEKGNQVISSIFQEAESWLITRFEELSSVEQKSLSDGFDQLTILFSRE